MSTCQTSHAHTTQHTKTYIRIFEICIHIPLSVTNCRFFISLEFEHCLHIIIGLCYTSNSWYRAITKKSPTETVRFFLTTFSR